MHATGFKRAARNADIWRMGGTRALLASLGASISLVAGAALSLLVVSFVFAYDGLGGTSDPTTTQAALLLDGATTTTSAQRAARHRAATPLVIKAAPKRGVSRPVVTRARSSKDETVAPTHQLKSTAPNVAAIDPNAPSSGGSGSGGSNPGDGVRDLGDSVSSTVQETGKATGAVTEPLGPPVTQAVQKVLDLLSSLLRSTTGALAGALDKTAGK